MSDLPICELEDIAWDEFCQSEDHIVPYPGIDRGDAPSIKGKIGEKTLCTISDSSEDRSLIYVSQGKEKRGLSNLSKMRKVIWEQDSWSPSSDGVFPSPSNSNSVKEESSLACENTRASIYGNNKADSNVSELCENDNLLRDKNASVDNNSFSYPLADISQTSNSVVFFENSEEKDPSNFLYYGWPEIGNFEDVDKMFRSSDSMFGLESCKENDANWLSLSDDIGPSSDVTRTDFKCPHPQADSVKDISNNNDSMKRFAIVDVKDELIHKEHVNEIRLKGKFQPKYFTNSHTKTGNNGMINQCKKQTKFQNQLEGKRKRQHGRNVCNRSNEVVQLPGASFPLLFPSVHNQQQHQTLGPDYYNCLQNSISSVRSGAGLLSDQTYVEPTPSSIKSEYEDIIYPSQNGSFQAANKFRFLEGSPPFYEASDEENEQKRKQHDLQGIGSSNIHECATISLGVDDISLEAAILRQLQLVTEQLDLRTKLCIRDSLYRLARGAEQRHNHVDKNGECSGIDASGVFKPQGTIFPGFMDMETDTNPIDRSIAHLLFRWPAETSVLPAHDSLLLKSPRMVHSAVREETLAETEKQYSSY